MRIANVWSMADILVNPSILSHRTQAAILNYAELLDEPNPMAFWVVCLLEDLWALWLQDFVMFCCSLASLSSTLIDYHSNPIAGKKSFPGT